MIDDRSHDLSHKSNPRGSKEMPTSEEDKPGAKAAATSMTLSNFGKEDQEVAEEATATPSLMALNHVSRLCRSVEETVDFYVKVLGFVPMEMPQAFDFEGAWLFNYGVGIHLVRAKEEDRLPGDTDPMDNHISFQCEDMEAMEQRLREFDVKYMQRTVEDREQGVGIDHLFFKDPNGFLIEICNENTKLVPAASGPDDHWRIKLSLLDHLYPPIELGNHHVNDKG